MDRNGHLSYFLYPLFANFCRLSPKLPSRHEFGWNLVFSIIRFSILLYAELLVVRFFYISRSYLRICSKIVIVESLSQKCYQRFSLLPNSTFNGIASIFLLDFSYHLSLRIHLLVTIFFV